MKYENIQDIFSRVAKQHPARVAVECGSLKVTYRDLEEDTNRLANFLLSEGATKGSVVAIMADKSIHVITAIIAVLKAGCAFAPLDRTLPANRLNAMLALIKPRWCIADTNDFDSEMRVICFDDAKHRATSQPNVESDPDQLCSIYFTSGSTGTPKPIAGRLKGISHFISWETEALDLADGVRVSQLTAPLWDAFLRDVFLPLSLGGTVCVPESRDLKLDARALADWIDASRVNVVHCVPSLFRALINVGLESDKFQSLRYVVLSGEPVLPADVGRWTDVFGERIRLVNLYGATETTMTKLYYFVNPSDKQRRSIPIGKPISGTAAVVVDAHDNACLPGEVGEILVRTPYRGLGYYNQPELTAEVFVPNPLSRDPKDIVYRTGDYGRLLDDGNLEFVGRKDHQVKVRGVRIELPEIENVLRSHESVRDVAVIDREDAIGNKYLCAYVVGEVDSVALKQHVAQSLPEYMMPSAFISLDALPRNVNGKLDRKALPVPSAEEAAFVEPRNSVERAVAKIWADVLGLQRVGVCDNFFQLGGHSLLATQVISRIRFELGSEVTLRQMFSGPTVAELSAAVEAGSGNLLAPPLVPVERTEALPLSFAQQRLWFLHQLAPGDPFYNVSAALRFSGVLNVAALEQTLSEIVRRHEILRTSFHESPDTGAPVQVIAAPKHLQLPLIDVREAETQSLIAEEVGTPFDLSVSPLLRVKLLRVGAEEHVLVVTMHHIVCDGWSIGIMVQEVMALYEAFLNREPSPLPELTVQYADFAVWQRNWLSDAVLDEQLSYWREQLQDAPAHLELATDHPRPAVQTYNGASAEVVLPKALSESVNHLSQREGVTLFMTLLAAFQTLLYRYTGQEDIVVGSPIANRNRAEIEGLIGFFVNTLAMRTKLDGTESFSELLQRVREVVLDAHSHQDLPFEKLVEELDPVRDMSRSPLFQVAFVLQNAPLQSFELPGLTLAQLDSGIKPAKFDLTLSATESSQGLMVSLNYNTDLFEATTIRRMLGHFQTLLENVVADPRQRILDCEVMPAVEKEQLLFEWNQRVDYLPEQTLDQLFSAQVARTPNNVAVIFEEERLTYAELDERANALAAELQQHGVGPEVTVGVCMERSIELVVSLLAVLKAGGAYVPLDPSYPQERLRFMIEDSKPAVILTTDNTDQSRGSDPDLIRAFDPSNPCYIIYTSGSTGTPKGVVVTHANVVRLFNATRRWFNFDENDVWTLFHSYAFDFSVWELWGALLYGGRLVIVPYLVSREPETFHQLLCKERVTVLNQTPSAFRQLMQIEQNAEDLALRYVIFGGEALELQSLAPWFERHGDEQPLLVNMYGITETTVHVTYRPIRKSDLEAASGSVIGERLPDLQTYVLDAAQQPVPIGVAGEMYVGGSGLARGYLQRPALTAERFVPHPWGAAGARLYRTGDRVRYLANGELEYLGRVDRQVKVRGFRIELGEIETVLAQHKDVNESVVVARDDDGDTRLVAYVVAGDALTVSDLHRHMNERLPEYMVPAAFVLLDRLPLTSNGKIDRRALPPPTGLRPELTQEYIPPRTSTELAIAQIWTEVVGVERVGIHDNFFELGGHSLLATQVISRLRNTLKVELPLRHIFQYPTVYALATQIEGAGENGLSALPIVPISHDGPVALSFAQQRLWFLDQLESNSSLYNIPAAYLLTGPLNVAALEQSINEVVRRHASLRTYFITSDDGSPVQLIAPAIQFALPQLDLRDLPETEREVEVRRLLAEESQKPFQLAEAPLLRCLLLRTRVEEHIFIFTMHHIICDGWSIGVLVEELTALYSAFLKQQPSPLPELAVQYVDFAVWQRNWLSGAVLDEQLSYWREQLRDAPAHLELATDHPRPAVQTSNGASTAVMLPAPLTESIKQLASREGATLFMTLLAAFQTLLYRYTGQNDICIGTPIANRNRAEIEGLIGFFVNTLVMRTQLNRADSFSELLQRVREVVLDAHSHQDLPFEKLVEELELERDLSRSPLFQVMFTLQNAPRRDIELPGLTLAQLGTDTTTAKFDLTMFVTEARQGLLVSLNYNTDLFEAVTIQRMLGHFQTVLESVVAEPQQRIGDCALLPAAEKEQLLVEWNATAVDYGPARLLHQLINDQVARTPDNVAVIFEEQTLTYAELDQRASALASELRGFGVGPDVLVGVCMERSAELVVALLATLKAGGAYLPLDPGYPCERLLFMVEDARPVVILSQPELLSILPEIETEVLLVGERGQAPLPDLLLSTELVLSQEAEQRSSQEDSFIPRAPQQRTSQEDLFIPRAPQQRTSQEDLFIPRASENRTSQEDLFIPRAPQQRTSQEEGLAPAAENLAYVIYTSGSTGQPKAAMNTHAGIVNRLLWMQEQYQLTDEDCVLQKTPFSFDVSVWEFFWPLLVGARLVLAKPAGHQDVNYLAELIERRQVTTLHFVPSMLQVFLANAELSRTATLKRVICSGEALSYELQQRFHAVSSAELHNLYGPTEASVDVTYWPCEPNDGRGIVPIGRPIANTEIYILDTHGQPVPAGVPGELLIGGIGLGRGYLNRPELTAERFQPHPFASEPGARLYRTGDLARYQAGGEIEYLGRMDQQVKVRGFRIELGEIEAALSTHPGVQESVVATNEVAPGDVRLIAYVVLADEAATSEELRQHLKTRLPEYMLPAYFVTLDQLPHLPNGKIDRRNLPAPSGLRPELTQEYIAPRTTSELAIAQIWTAVLGVERVGIHDNFFELGGHSLLATQVISRLRNALKIELPLRHIFQYPTVHALATKIEGAGNNALSAPPIVPVSHDGPVALSFAQQRLWFLDQLESNTSLYNMPAAYSLHGKLDIRALEQSLNELLRRHASLRTAFVTTEDGNPAQQILPATPFTLPQLDLRDLPEAERELEVRRLLAEESQKPFQLSNAPLLRCLLLRTGEEDHIFIFTMHHIICDGWSIGVLVEELTTLYTAFLKQQPSPLPKLAVQYADFAVWQRHWLSGAVLDQQLAYWREQLRDAPARLELATDHPRPAVQTANGASAAVMLPNALSESIKQLASHEGATLFMTLLAAFQTLLYRYTGQNDICIGTPIANRNRAEIERLIGFFVNTLVMRAKLDGKESFSELLQRVREVVLDAYSHQDLPFEKLVEELDPERDLSRSSLFQVMFTFQNTPRQTIELPGLTLAQLGIEASTAKFDLTMFVTEARQGLLVSLKYNTDLFEAATIERMLSHFQTLLEAVVQEPQTKLGQLSLLTNAEQQLLREWNETATEYRRDVCLHELFEDQVARTPEREAVIFRDERLTFAELNARADELAQQLRRQGVGPEVRVALQMERSLEIVVAMLAIWKAGGVYVPLDITQPQQRLQLMLDDAGVQVVLKDGSDPDSIRAFDPRHPRSNNLAYIIYTSGSTGTPKGVMVTHRSVVNLISALQQAIYSKQSNPLRVSLNAQISFDASIKQLIQLLSGHTLVVIPEEVRASGPELLEHLKAQRVNVLDCTPSQLQLLLATESWRQESVPQLLLVGGESISTDLWDRLAADPSRDYYNVYGPTECTVDATVAKVQGDTPNIGRPIANTRIHLLDQELQQIPPGVRGEICIAGECLARGYLNRPDLTAERFVPDPHSDAPGARMYRTGDLARYRADGTIEFAGRLDDQVKVRGHRIELGEIETVLSAHERVSEAVVLAHEERLVAYIATEAEPSQLREYLQERLPEYMIPTAWVKLEALPLTTNGKVDRKALPALGLAQTAAAETYVAPRTPMEEMLASIWSELLQVERIGIHDNFFALGGHSLLATRVITRVRNVFNIEIPIRRLFETPTIAGLAVAVVQEQASQVEDDEMAQIIAELEYLSDDDALSQVNH